MPRSPTSIYFVLCDFGAKVGRSWIARDPAAMDWQSTVDDIASGQIEDMIEVREASTWADVTRDIAWDVSDQWAHAGESLKDNRYSFIEQHLGTRAARSFVRAA
jgi:hypothetical protein